LENGLDGKHLYKDEMG